MKCDHCGVKRFVCLMYNCTDLNSCACRVLDVLHTRLRHRSSNLNADHFRVNLINDSGCVCGWVKVWSKKENMSYDTIVT
jgi:hypothetical protein